MDILEIDIPLRLLSPAVNFQFNKRDYITGVLTNSIGVGL